MHLSTLWLRDADTNISRPFSIPVRASGRRPQGVARHFISVPYEDGHALENYFVELIDTAEHHIEIVNPYLNLTPKLALAMDRALARGVKVDIIGRIDLKAASFWCGLRPMTPDGPPLVGRSELSNLYLNTGHGTLGWTMACGSAKVLADIISSRVPEINARDLGPERYLK